MLSGLKIVYIGRFLKFEFTLAEPIYLKNEKKGHSYEVSEEVIRDRKVV